MSSEANSGRELLLTWKASVISTHTEGRGDRVSPCPPNVLVGVLYWHDLHR